MATDRQTGREIGQLVNFSEEGILLMGKDPIAEHSVLQLSLSFESAKSDEDAIQLGVESLWSHANDDNSRHWTGFSIIDISDQNLERLRTMTG
jgi:hypothetical protein